MSRWLLLRGLAREARHWGDLPLRLACADRGATVVTLDLPGTGRRHAEQAPATIAATLRDCRDRLRLAGHPPPYRLLAISLGGMLASAWCHRWPDEIEHAVLINTSLCPFSPFWQRLRPGAWADLAAIALSRDPVAAERRILRRTSNRLPNDPDALTALAERWAGWRRDCPISSGNAARQLLAALRQRAPSAPPPVPLRLLAGAGDRLVDPRCSQRLAAAWRCPLQLHPWAGHDLPLDDPDWVVAQTVPRRAGRSQR